MGASDGWGISVKTWHYEDNGDQHGPVGEADLRLMLEQGLLSAQTRVWTENFGPTWKSAADAGLLAGSKPVPPPLPPRVARTASESAATTSNTPTRRFSRLVALMPVFVLGFDILLAMFGINPNLPPVSSGTAFWSAVLTIIFAVKDARLVTDAGLNPKGRAIAPFILLTPIGYFLRRKQVANLPLTELWVWLGCVLVFLIGKGVLLT